MLLGWLLFVLLVLTVVGQIVLESTFISILRFGQDRAKDVAPEPTMSASGVSDGYNVQRLLDYVTSQGRGMLAVKMDETPEGTLWIVHAEFGYESEGSPMAAGATDQIHENLGVALRLACEECGLGY